MHVSQKKLLACGNSEPSLVLDGLMVWLDGRDTISNNQVPDRVSGNSCAITPNQLYLVNRPGAYYLIEAPNMYQRNLSVSVPSGITLTGVKTVEMSIKLLSTSNMGQGDTVFMSFFTSRYDWWRSTAFSGGIKAINAESTHMLSTTDGTICKTYFNGVLIRSDNIAQLPDVTSIMEYRKPQGSSGSIAYIGTIRVYNKTFSEKEVLNNYRYEIGLERY